jgi:hypothetical protein
MCQQSPAWKRPSVLIPTAFSLHREANQITALAGQASTPSGWFDVGGWRERLPSWVDRTSAALGWLETVRRAVCVISCLRLDAVLYAPAPPHKARQNGRPWKKGEWLPMLEEVLPDSTPR